MGVLNAIKLCGANMEQGRTLISQSRVLFCAADTLSTEARGTMKQPVLKSELKLRNSQDILLNHPIGYSI